MSEGLEAARRATACWVEQVVVGMNLCPFATGPLSRGHIDIQVFDATEDEAVYQQVVTALEAFLKADPDVQETALLVFPQALQDFEHYNDFLGVLEDLLEDTGLENDLQIASFHPDYRFADAEPDDPGHFTNRSPHPMFHLIRQDQMARAIAHFPDPESIPERNVRVLQEEGWDAMAGRLARCRKPA